MMAAVTVIAPARSRRLSVPGILWSGGRSLRHHTNTAMPIGMLTRKIQFHAAISVMTPPSSTPTAPPPERTKPTIPIALARSPGSVNMIMSSDSTTTETIAPPTP
jgi:hypothetical protein